jgi:hypothetical protein
MKIVFSSNVDKFRISELFVNIRSSLFGPTVAFVVADAVVEVVFIMGVVCPGKQTAVSRNA